MHSLSLKDDGVTLLPKVLSTAICRDCLKDLKRMSVDHNLVTRSPYSTHIHNAFLFSSNIRDLLSSPEIANIYKDYFGDMYILRNFVASTISRSKQPEAALGKPIGHTWHRDTPQFYTHDNLSVCLPGATTFQLIIALERTSPTNSTEFLLQTNNDHSISSHRMPADNDLSNQYESRKLIMDVGDIAILDDSTFHRAGKPDGNSSRWLLFISFVPWFIQPYFLYKEIQSANQFERHIFGHCINPPHPLEKIKNSFRSQLSL